MAESHEVTAKAAGTTASESLSQLVARILNQLAISAWLPSAALVLLLAFIAQLGVALNSKESAAFISWFDAVTATFENLGSMSVGSFFLLIAAVIVLTMLTQAFTFEAIRLFEGYWGGRWPLYWLAYSMCGWHRWRLRGIENRRLEMARSAWESAEGRIRAEQHVRGDLSCRLISALRQRVCQEHPQITLTPEEQERVSNYDWTRHASPEPLRREMVAAKHLSDYPAAHHIMPTQLGNILRRFEDDSGEQVIESLVEDRFDRLPFSLQLSHDELRGRLDLYCSMTLVWIFAGIVAVVRFAWTTHASYGWWLFASCLAATLFTYRAAVASARHYGPLLVRIAQYPTLGSAMELAGDEGATTRRHWLRRR